MKASFNLKRLTSTAALVIVAGFAFSCQNKGDDSGSAPRVVRTNGSTANELPAPFQTSENGKNYFYSQSAGRIFSASTYADEFNQAIQDFVSATMDPADLGYVSPLNGVVLRGYVELDTYGSVVPSRSMIEVEIRDEWAGKLQDGVTIPAIKVRLPAVSGTANSTQSQIRFEDSYGSITLIGSYTNGGKFEGEFRFENYNGTQGSNIAFEIQTCGFFRCE